MIQSEDRMQVTLTVTDGPHLGRVFTFREHDNFIVGRAACAHFRLPLKDKYFSRVHFMVEVNPPSCRLVDMGSTNGTRVNGRKVTKADLKDGDRIKGGETGISVAIEEGVDSSLFESKELDNSAAPWEHPAARSPEENERAASPRSTSQTLISSLVSPPASDQPTSGCRICGNSQVEARPSPQLGGDLEKAPLCPICREQILNQHQPIAGYQIVRELGSGGMGVVYLALREADGTPVALKTITPAIIPSEKDLARFCARRRFSANSTNRTSSPVSTSARRRVSFTSPWSTCRARMRNGCSWSPAGRCLLTRP